MISDIGSVIQWKFPSKEGMMTRGDEIVTFPGGIPSQADQDTWTAEYEAYVAANEYKGLRKEEYPSIADQLDDIYHNGIDAWKATIKLTKDKYPKS
jgi:hypothetical protein